MNESQLIREQLALERAHLGAVAHACAAALKAVPPAGRAALAQFQQACLEYLDCVLGWYEERDRRLAHLAAALDAQDPRGGTVNEILGRAGGGGEALTKLTAAKVSPGAWNDFIQFLSGPWSTRRDALEQLLARDSRGLEWRRIGGIDADGILEERKHFARVAATLPPGVGLGASPRAG